MATQTPNLGLTLPIGTENVSRTVVNGNNTLIDTFAGNVNTAMDQMGSNLGILETGDTATHAIAKGEYVTWKGASYTADAAISIGETLAATGGSKNLTACDKGIANALNSKTTYVDTNRQYIAKVGNVVYFLLNGELPPNEALPEAYRPHMTIGAPCAAFYNGTWHFAMMNIGADGTYAYYINGALANPSFVSLCVSYLTQ